MSDVREIAADLLRRSQAMNLDEVEVAVARNRRIEVTIEKNEIHMTRVQEEPAIGVRVIHDKGLGFASTNSFELASLEEALGNAAALARSCPADENNGLPDPAPLPEVSDIYDPGVAALSPEGALENAQIMLQAALDTDPRVRVDAGAYEIDVMETAVRSTRGVLTYEQETLASANLMALAVDGGTVSGFDYWGECSRALSGLHPEALGKDLARRVISGLGARRGGSFSGVAVFSPRVVQQLLVSPLLFAVNADNVQRGMSRLSSSLDRSVAAPGIELADDGTRTGEAGSSAFDREGMPRRSLPLLEEGRLAAFLHNAYTARKGGTQTTGHAAGGARSIPGVGATNVVVQTGQDELDSLIKGIKQGILITRFSGHPKLVSGDFSGAVKGGFMIENGEITHPICETMISGNTFDLLPRVVGISSEAKRYYTLSTPTLVVDGVSFSSRP